MRAATRTLTQLLRNGDGTTAVEYAALISLVLLVCISSAQALNSAVNDSFAQPLKTPNARSANKAGPAASKNTGTGRVRTNGPRRVGRP